MSKREYWNDRYGGKGLVWGFEPNRFVADAFGEVAPRGRALDLACGEGRNAIWLAERGWDVTGVDFSREAIERAHQLALQRGVQVRFLEADVTSWSPEAGAYALVLVAYLQIPEPDLQVVWNNAAAALENNGELFLIGHARRNLEEGVGGPSDPKVLWELESIAAQLVDAGLQIDRAEHVLRPVDDAARQAIDVRIRAHRGRT